MGETRERQRDRETEQLRAEWAAAASSVGIPTIPGYIAVSAASLLPPLPPLPPRCFPAASPLPLRCLRCLPAASAASLSLAAPAVVMEGCDGSVALGVFLLSSSFAVLAVLSGRKFP